MDIVEMLMRAQGGSAFENLGRQVGLNKDQTRSAVEQLAPVVAAGLRRNAGDDNGFTDLLGALQRGSHSRYVDDADTLADARDDGNNILGHIFGSKDVSRAVAAHAADQTGIGSGILKQLLPIIASMVMGSLSNRTREPGLQDVLGQVLGGALGGGGGGGGSGGGLLESVLGGILGGGSDASREVQRRRSDAGRDNDSLGLDDLFGDILGGGSSSSSDSSRSVSDSTRRSGGGSAADDLLEAVLRNTRR